AKTIPPINKICFIILRRAESSKSAGLSSREFAGHFFARRTDIYLTPSAESCIKPRQKQWLFSHEPIPPQTRRRLAGRG
ncbi:MAG: hypothetical protein WCH99_22615, partial [Verrucomicrobiota bacterium]